MDKEKLITANNIDEVWPQITEDLKDNEFDYSVIISIQNRKVYLDIDVDPGGGFEGGYQTTTLRSRLENVGEFRFALHHQGLLDEIGKFFGMEDIETAYLEFDGALQTIDTFDCNGFIISETDYKIPGDKVTITLKKQ